MTILDAVRLALIILAPALVFLAVERIPGWWSAIQERRQARRCAGPQPYGPPIEQLATNLRRLLRLHNDMSASAHAALSAHRVWAVEAAIGTLAIEAAVALGVPHPHPDTAATMTRSELRRLLTALAAAGLVLPARVSPFTNDGRL